MKKLVIVRHGEDDYVGKLSDNGREQMALLAKALASFINKDDRVFVVTSGEERSDSSGEILVQNLNKGVVEQTVRNEADGALAPPTHFGVESVTELGKGVDVLIVVAHHDTCSYLPDEYMKKFGWRGSARMIYNGAAYVVDFEEKRLTWVE